MTKTCLNAHYQISREATERDIDKFSTSPPAACCALRGGRACHLYTLVAIVVKAALDDWLIAVAVSCRCLLGILLHELVCTLSCGAHTALLLHRRLLLRVVVDFHAGALSTVWRREASADCLDHLREPEDVEQVQGDVGGQVRCAEPEREIAGLHESSGLTDRVVEISVVRKLFELVHELLGSAVSFCNRAVDILEDQDAAVVAPDETAAEESRGKESTIDSLVDRAGEVELVAEPVNVQEGAGKLVQEEHRCVVVEEWTLRRVNECDKR